MTTTVGAYEAKSRLSEYLERASKGEEFIVTRRGEPIARITPLESSRDHDADKVRMAIERIRHRNNTEKIKGVTAAEIKDWINEGRRY